MDATEAKSDSAFPTPSFCIVGVGASAGGLEALERLFHGMPLDTGIAFVVLHHLSPDYESKMDALLARQTTIPIVAAQNGERPQPNMIYLAPARSEIILSGGRFVLADKDPNKGFSLPIDALFRSLASDVGDSAVGIVLSGTGSDGARGIGEIHQSEGLVLCQAPETARFDGMPRSAIATGHVDLVLAPENMAQALLDYAVGHAKPEPSHLTHEPPATGIHRIVNLLRDQYGIDLTHYKPNTVMRRVERRVALTAARDIDGYAERLHGDPAELDILYRDLLIGVTKFFRDEEAFVALEKLIAHQFTTVESGATQELRVWVPGCATGEEAYSLAILLHEQLEAAKSSRPVKIFATDLHPLSLEIGSAGVYSEEALAGMTPERCARYFQPTGNGRFQVSKELRRLVVFARHNVMSDAPFTRLDLVSCRNVLIYFQPAAQKKVLSLFHFSLRTGGLLFLGLTETPGALRDELEAVSERWKIYKKRRDIRLPFEVRLPLRPDPPFGSASRTTPVGRRAPDAGLSRVYDQLLDRFMPPALLVDEQGELLHTFGAANQLMQLPRGRTSTNVRELVHPDFRAALSGALRSAHKNGKSVSYTGIEVATASGPKRYRIAVEPIANKHTQGTDFLVLLEELGAAPPAAPSSEVDAGGTAGGTARDYVAELESELRFTKENLQATIEELETSNEELQAINEELVASLEELQSTNEELHSVNEELYTVNAENQAQIGVLRELTDDLDNTLRSIDVGVVFLDRDLHIRKFTQSAGAVLHMEPEDVGRRLDPFAHHLRRVDLEADLKQVLAQGEPIEREVETSAGRFLLLRVLPYRTATNVAGIIVTLVDIHNVKQSEDRVRRLSAIVESSSDAIIATDLDGKILSWNSGAERLYGYPATDMMGLPVVSLMPAERTAEYRMVVGKIAQNDVVPPFESVSVRKDGHPIAVSMSVSPLRETSGDVQGVALIVTDITARKLAERAARGAIKQREHFLAMLSHELRNPLMGILTAAELLGDRRTADNVKQRTCDVIKRQSQQMGRILDDLLDVSRMRQDKIEMRKREANLSDVAASALDAVRSRAATAGIGIDVEMPEDPIWINGDPARLQQMVVNLLGNAIKYSPPQQPITLTIERRGAKAVVAVKDLGVGIPKEMHKAIFEPFQRGVDPPLREDGRGMGLGLALVASIVRAHDGWVEVTSEGRGKGSVFTVFLPTLEGKAKGAQPHDGADAADRPECASYVLLVEDQIDNRELVAVALQQRGYRVRTAATGTDALALAKKDRPAMAVVDLGLPDVSGLDVARGIRKLYGPTGVLLVALTGHGRQADREAVRGAGFDAHLVKPVPIGLLDRVLQGSSAESAMADDESDTATSSEP